MTTIIVHSFKGCTGKSLLAVFLAYYFSKKKEKVLIIDGDYWAPCLSTYFHPKRKCNPFTAFLDGDCDFEQVVSKTSFQDLSICYSPQPNFSEKILQADVQTHERYLKRMFEGIEIAKKSVGLCTAA